jgi:hypothetical protein
MSSSGIKASVTGCFTQPFAHILFKTVIYNKGPALDPSGFEALVMRVIG